MKSQDSFHLGPAPEPTDKCPTEQAQIEGLLAELWSQLLGINEISVDDDILQLGATSLMAMQITSRLRRILGRHVPLNIVFEHTTISELASAVLESKAARRVGGYGDADDQSHTSG